jgi:hypothetical protein
MNSESVMIEIGIETSPLLLAKRFPPKRLSPLPVAEELKHDKLAIQLEPDNVEPGVN